MSRSLPRKSHSSPSPRSKPYLTLLANDPDTKERFEAIAKQCEGYGDAHFGPGDPQVVEWFPRRNAWSAGADFHFDEYYLVIQPLTFGVPKWEEWNGAAISEFRVLHEGVNRIDPHDPKEREHLVSNKITIQFLGFRTLTLKTLK